MIVRMCIVCSWYNDKREYCNVNKRTVSPCDSCNKFHNGSQDILENSSRLSQDNNDLSEIATFRLSKTPSAYMVKPSFI